MNLFRKLKDKLALLLVRCIGIVNGASVSSPPASTTKSALPKPTASKGGELLAGLHVPRISSQPKPTADSVRIAAAEEKRRRRKERNIRNEKR